MPSRVLATALPAMLGLALALSPFGAGPARADALIIEVNTTADTEAADGKCSLREAIKASSNGGRWYECQGSSGVDTIQFNIGTGTPLIQIGKALPTITAPVTIRGNTGGATRVRLQGTPAMRGLDLDSGADGSSIRSMHIDGFEAGIWASGATATIAGNVFTGNSAGILGMHSTLTIGGINTPTETRKCAGDCNLISGNTTGILLTSMQFFSIKGNFVGVNAMGAAAQRNTSTGISIRGGAGSIGGPSVGERNLISGNGTDGMKVSLCQCVVKGNFVGTDQTGKNAIANGASGIWVQSGGTVVGGTAAGDGNLISGNAGHGVYLQTWEGGLDSFNAYGNRIGIKNGGGALGNGGDGIRVYGQEKPVWKAAIGSASGSNGANVIAFNGGAGVRIMGAAVHVSVRRNSIHSNAGRGIALDGGVNEAIAKPHVIDRAPLSGAACANCTVEIYSDSADEGRTFEGSAIADGSGFWTFAESVVGPKVTVTATDSLGNTSEFSTPLSLAVPPQPDGRIRQGLGKTVGNDIYNTTGANQAAAGTADIGETITFDITIQGDSGNDKLKLRATGLATSQYSVQYFRGTTDITTAVVDGRYTTPLLAQGVTFLISAKVKVLKSATIGSSVVRLVTITSVGDPTRKDAVKFAGGRI